MTAREPRFSPYLRSLLRRVIWVSSTLCWVCAAIALAVGLWKIAHEKPTAPLLADEPSQACTNLEWMYRAHWDPEATSWHVKLGGLKVADGQLGLFSSPLYKTVMIDSLHIRQCRGRVDQELPAAETGATGGLQALDELAGPALDQVRRWLRCWDCANTAKLFIKDFRFEKKQPQHPPLTVTCLLVQASYESRELELRGRVQIENNEGKRLVSGRVVWDPRLKRFHVPGQFKIIEQGQAITGQAAWFTEELSALSAEHASL